MGTLNDLMMRMHGHHSAEMGEIHRRAIAKDLGVDESIVSPFEGSKNTTINNIKKTGLLPAVLGTLGAVAGGMALWAGLNGKPTQLPVSPPIAQQLPNITPPDVKVDDIELEVSWEVLPNGETKVDVQEVPK